MQENPDLVSDWGGKERSGGSRSNARKIKMFDNKETAFFFLSRPSAHAQGKGKGEVSEQLQVKEV